MRATGDVLHETVFLREVMNCWDGARTPDSFKRGIVRVCAGEWRREADERWRLFVFDENELPPARQNHL